MAGFRFPVEAAHEGGASRLIAHLVYLPLYVHTLRGGFGGRGGIGRAGAALAIGFLMHPSAFVTLAMRIFAAAFVVALKKSCAMSSPLIAKVY